MNGAKTASVKSVTTDTKILDAKRVETAELLVDGVSISEVVPKWKPREHIYRCVLEEDDDYIIYDDEGNFLDCKLDTLENGTGLFQGTKGVEEFSFSLPNLTTGGNMFANCNLGEKAVESILRTIPEYSEGSHPLTMNMSTDAFEKFNEITGNYLMEPGTISYKGWNIASNAVIIIPVEELTNAIEEIIGEGKVIVDTVPTESKVIVHTDRADDNQLEAVTTLLERVLPQKVEVVHTNYFTWLPSDYTAVEYLESSYGQLIDTGVVPDNETGALCDIAFIQKRSLAIQSKDSNGRWSTPRAFSDWNNYSGYFWGIWKNWDILDISAVDRNVCSINWLNNRLAIVKGVKEAKDELPELPYTPSGAISLFGHREDLWSGKLYGAQISQGKNIIHDYVPCLDKTGAPCLFDLVNRTTFYNQGTGDFLYPTESATYSLRHVLPDWGKLTKHGIRRLYRVPEGYKGSEEDYAQEFGFKQLVENPQPEEGSWRPEWVETDNELILNWIEVEEEELTNV